MFVWVFDKMTRTRSWQSLFPETVETLTLNRPGWTMGDERFGFWSKSDIAKPHSLRVTLEVTAMSWRRSG
jgi:hypothetical protein